MTHKYDLLETSRLLGLSFFDLVNKANRGEISYQKEAGSVFFSEEGILHYLDTLSPAPAPPEVVESKEVKTAPEKVIPDKNEELVSAPVLRTPAFLPTTSVQPFPLTEGEINLRYRKVVAVVGELATRRMCGTRGGSILEESDAVFNSYLEKLGCVLGKIQEIYAFQNIPAEFSPIRAPTKFSDSFRLEQLSLKVDELYQPILQEKENDILPK